MPTHPRTRRSPGAGRRSGYESRQMALACRTCGFALPDSKLCRNCGEDHRAWLARLVAVEHAPTLWSQEAEIERMQLELERQRAVLGDESARVARHHASTSEGAAIVAEAGERVKAGILALDASRRQLEAATLGVHATRGHMALEHVRSNLASPPVPPSPVSQRGADTTATTDSETGMTLVQSGTTNAMTCWSPTRALRPLWTRSLAGTPSFAGGSARRLLVQTTAGAMVHNASDGAVLWTWDGVLLDTWADRALLATQNGVVVRDLRTGQALVSLPAAEVRAGRLLPGGVLVWSEAEGLTVLDDVGQRVARARFGSNLILSEDRKTLVAFPMLLRLPDLSPQLGLRRTSASPSSFFLDERVLVGLGPQLTVWRLDDAGRSGASCLIDLPAAAEQVARVADMLLVRTADGVVGVNLASGTPRLQDDAFETCRAQVQVRLRRFPTRFRFLGDTRRDRAVGEMSERADLCHDIATYAATYLDQAELDGEATGLPADLMRASLVVEVEVLHHLALKLSEHLSAPEGVVAYSRLLDRALQPIFLYRSRPKAGEAAATARIHGLLAACAEAALSAVGQRLSRRALDGEAEEGEIDAAIAVLGRVRREVLIRAAGLPWLGLDTLMARWKLVVRHARELRDVAVATRALGRVAAAASIAHGDADQNTLEGLGRAISDLAARSTADAEVDALLADGAADEVVLKGMERVRETLRRR